MGLRLFAAVFAAFLFLPANAMAQERHALRAGFAFPKDRVVKIAVLRPDVRVGTLTTGGVDEPNADWTAEARKLMENELKANSQVAGAEVIFPAEPEGEDGAYLAEYRALFGAVADSIVVHKLFPGNRLPTKKTVFDWTLGEGIARLGQITQADYALFVYTHDAYGSSGRKAAQVFGLLMGVAIVPGIHIGYAGMVDLKTGEIVWFNADPQMGGDIRTAEGASKRVWQLLDGLPGRPLPPKVGARK